MAWQAIEDIVWLETFNDVAAGRIGISIYLAKEDAPCCPHQTPPPQPLRTRANRSLQLLLRAQLVGVATLLLAAVGGTRWKTGLRLLALARILDRRLW